MTKTDALRGRFEEAKCEAFKNDRAFKHTDDIPSFSNGFEYGWYTAQLTEAEIEELAREIAGLTPMHLSAEPDTRGWTKHVASLLRGKLGGMGR